MRAFIAIPIPKEAENSFNSIQIGVKNMRWVSNEYLHITLCFLGEVDSETIEALLFALTDIKFHKFEIKVRGVNYFCRKGRVHSVWAGIESSDPLLKLREKVVHICRKFSRGPGRKRFTPHVTVGRIKAAPISNIEAWLQNNNDFALDTIIVKDFVFFESQLGLKRVWYKPLQQYRLE